jgi:hypothetical protein
MIKIESLQQLKKQSKCGAEFFIILKFNLKSTKWIEWDEQNATFYVINFSDDSDQSLTDTQLFDRRYSNIGHAIHKGCLYKDH